MSEAHKNQGTGMRAAVEGSTDSPSERGASHLSPAQSRSTALSHGIPSTPLLKVLPIARVIPQDVHSVMDYLDGATVAAGAMITKCPKARAWHSWCPPQGTGSSNDTAWFGLASPELEPTNGSESLSMPQRTAFECAESCTPWLESA